MSGPGYFWKLSVTASPDRPLHVFVEHEPHDGPCPLCDGGLALCAVCGGLEGVLLDSCPGVQLTAEQHEWNHQANLRRMRAAARAQR